MGGIALAYLAGLLTLLNPCVLPLLPVVLAGALARHRAGPLALAIGLAASFTVFGFLIYAFAQAAGFQQEDIAAGGALAMIAFGAILLVPQANAAFSRAAGALAGGGNRAIDAFEGNSLWRQAAAGALLGLVWSPCIGPTLGGAIALASQGESLGFAFLLMLSFSLGVATVMLALGYGGREIIRRRRDLLMRVSSYAAPVMGVALIAVGLFLWFGINRTIDTWVLDTLPAWFNDISVSI
jgi:cytochrome c biogenesis protein CcdA